MRAFACRIVGPGGRETAARTVQGWCERSRARRRSWRTPRLPLRVERAGAWPAGRGTSSGQAGWANFCTGARARRSSTMVEHTRGGAGRYDPVREGMDVLDQNGDKIGKAGETLGGGGYFNVDAGFLGMKEYYVPFDAVTEVQDDAVYLNVTKDRLGEMGWDRRPDERAGEMGTTTTAGTDTGRQTVQLHA